MALPSLPILPLFVVCERYLKSIEPLVSVAQLNETAALVSRFLEPGGDGETLHAALVARRDQSENWLEEWWLKV